MKVFKLQYEDIITYAGIENKYEFHSYSIHKVYVGDKTTCIVCTLWVPSIQSIGEETDAFLEMYHMDTSSIYTTFANHTRTMQLTKMAMTFIYHMYNISEFKVEEDSYMVEENGYTFPSKYYYMAVHGKTWYELAYDARIEYHRSIKVKDTYEAQKRMFEEMVTSTDEKKIIHWDKFCDMYKVQDIHRTLLRKLYDESDNIRTFIKNIPHLSSMFRWIERFVSQHVDIPMNWILDCRHDHNNYLHGMVQEQVHGIVHEQCAIKNNENTQHEFMDETLLIRGKMKL